VVNNTSEEEYTSITEDFERLSESLEGKKK
jgi:hypothetical protein